MSARAASFAQRRVWFLAEMHPERPLYNVVRSFRLEGPLREGALIAACEALALRHEALRTTFRFDGGELLQEVREPGVVAPRVVDGAGMDDAAVLDAVERAARATFDLSNDPPFRAVLLRRSAESHVLVLVWHHIAVDGWSLAIVLNELAALYAAHGGIRGTALADVPLAYSSYAEGQRRGAGDERWSHDLDHWLGKLSGATPLALPADRPRPAIRMGAGARHRFHFPAEVTAAVGAARREHGVTSFMLLLAAFQTLLHRYTGQDDIVVGSPFANRDRVELEQVVGLFANTVVMRSSFAGDPTFACLLRQVREATLDAFAHLGLPFEALVERLHPERSLGQPPLVQVMFALQTAAAKPLVLEGLRVSPVEVDLATAQLDMTWELEETPEGLRGVVDYSTELFDAGTVERMVANFGALLRSIGARGGDRVSMLPLLSDEERAALDRQSGGGSSVHDPEPIHEAFAAQARRTPDAVAIVDGVRCTTYSNLDSAADALAARLRRAGVERDGLVGLCVQRSARLVEGMLGILKAGGAYLPLDPAHPDARLRQLASDARIGVLVTEASLAERFRSGGAGDVSLLPTVIIDAPGEEDEGQALFVPAKVDVENLCYAMFTSGSAGAPKAVMIPHRNVSRLFSALRGPYPFGPSDVWTCFHSAAFDFSVWEIWGALLSGGRLVFVPSSMARSPDLFVDLLERERVTVLSQTPLAFGQLLTVMGLMDRPPTLDVRFVVFGGDALDARAVAPWFERHGEAGGLLVNMYGITETTVHVTHRPVTPGDAGRTASLIGRPLDDLRLHVLDRHGNPAPIGVPGELCVAGPGLARGYLDRPGETAARFVPDPFSAEPGARMYRSGDLGRRLADGDVEYLGRIDAQVKIRGHRVEPAEIEAALRRHPAVGDAAVVVRRDASGAAFLEAHVVAVGSARLPVGELRAWLQRTLPEPMVPAVLVELAALPLTANGKIDRSALRSPGGARPELAEPYEAPITEVEALLADIWGEVLRVTPIGIDDNFFALGGDSIRSLQVLERARRRGLRFALQDLFLHQTVRGLARAVAAQLGGPDHERPATSPFGLLTAAERAALPAGIVDAYPLTSLQLGMLYHSEVASDSNMYHNTGGVHVETARPFDRAAFEQAVREVVARHPAFRTGFAMIGHDRPLQLVHAEAHLPLEVHDISALAPSEQDRVLSELLESEKARPFDLARPTLLRFFVHLRSPRSFQLTITECHAIFDGWSYHSTVVELFGVYAALVDGRAVARPAEASVTFRDYVALEQEALASEVSRAFWASTVSGCTIAALPRWESTRASGGRLHVARMRIQFSDEIYRGLQALLRRAGVPLKSALLAAHVKVLAALTAHDDVLTGMVTNGRPEAEDGARVVGLFLNTVPFRQRLSPCRWLELVRRSFALEREMLPHRRYPLAAIQRDAGRGPLCDEVAFNFMDFHVYDELPSALGLRVLSEMNSEGTNFKLVAQFQHLTMVSLLAREQVALHLHYDADEFPEAQVAMIGEAYAAVLRRMAADPDARHDAVPILPAEDRRRALSASGGDLAIAGARTIHERFAAQVARTPGAIAVVGPDGELTYRELDARANRLARVLARLGVGPERAVGVAARRSVEVIVALLAVLKAGGVYAPIDTQQPPEQLEAICEESDLRAFVALGASQGAAPAGARRDSLPWLLDWLASRRVPVVAPDGADRAEILAQPSTAPDARVAPEDVAYTIFTSGTTGRPRGVMVEHRSVVSLVAGLRAAIPRYRDATGPLRVAVNGPLTFDTSIKQLAQLMEGHTLVLLSEEERLDVSALERALETIDVFDCTPSHLRVLGELGLFAPERATPLTVLVGGEAIDGELWRELSENAAVDAWNLYGPTECTVDATVSPIRGATPTIGRALANVRTYVLDARGEPVPIGAIGELYIGGASVSRGYAARPGETAAAFLPDPFFGEPGARMYRTGDRVRMRRDGRIEFEGRADHQVKIRGFRVELEGVAAVLRRHPDVRAAGVSVAGTPDSPRIVACVQPRPRRAATLGDRARYVLPNGLAIAHFHRHETDFLFGEVFERQAYTRHGVDVRDGAVVFDVGAHIGLFSLYSHLRARDVRVYAFEPNPITSALLRANTAHYGADVRALDVGLSDAARSADFTFYPRFSYLSGLYADAERERALVHAHVARSRSEGRAAPLLEQSDFRDFLGELLSDRLQGERFTVRLSTLSEAMRGLGVERVDLLKINAERSELDVLRGIEEEDWPRIHQIALELEDTESRLERALELLRRHGFGVTVEHDWSLAESSRVFYLYATRTDDGDAAAPPPSGRRAALLAEHLPLTPQELRAFVEERLPGHMVPSEIALVDEMPLTRHGKIDHAAIARRFAEPAVRSAAHEAPASAAEERVAAIWRQTLGADRVLLDQPFFDAGGDSLQLLRVRSRLHQEFGRDVPLVALLRLPTVRSLAAYLAQPPESP